MSNLKSCLSDLWTVLCSQIPSDPSTAGMAAGLLLSVICMGFIWMCYPE